MIQGKDCYKVKLSPANGDAGEMNVWISKGAHAMPLQYEISLPELNGATMKATLKKS